MKLTDCKPGMLVWWGWANGVSCEATIVRPCNVLVRIDATEPTGWRVTVNVDPKNLYPRTI